jgi:ribosomal protein L37AE/L43A
MDKCTFCGSDRVELKAWNINYCRECKRANSVCSDYNIWENVRIAGMAKRICELEQEIKRLKLNAGQGLQQ